MSGSEDTPRTKTTVHLNQELKKGQKLVSAIISTFKAERFLHGCLADLLNQSIANHLEIIIVDSNSPQNERKIVAEFQKNHENIIYVRTGRTESLYKAWNRAIQLASGKYITNANSDDRHHPRAYERMAGYLERHEDIALVYANVIITETENETYENHTPVGMFRWRDFDPATMIKGCYMGPQPMWRRSLHKTYGYFDESFESCGDWEFWLRMGAAEKFHHIDEPLGLYLRSPGGIEHRDPQLSAAEGQKARQRHWPRYQKIIMERARAGTLPPEFKQVRDENGNIRIQL